MLRIVDDSDFEYSVNDTFILPIEVEGDGFDENSKMRMIIAKDEISESIVDNTFGFSDGGFVISLSGEDKKKLVPGSYIYKLISTAADGMVITEISGNFRVKWGA